MSRVTTVQRRVTAVEEISATVVTQADPGNRGWSGVQLCTVLGFARSKSTQAGRSAFEKVAVCWLADDTRTLQTLLDLVREPSANMLNIIERRNKRLRVPGGAQPLRSATKQT